MNKHDITTENDWITIGVGYGLLPPNVITPNTLRRWALEGRIPARRLGHKLLVRRVDVLALLQPLDAA